MYIRLKSGALVRLSAACFLPPSPPARRLHPVVRYSVRVPVRPPHSSSRVPTSPFISLTALLALAHTHLFTICASASVHFHAPYSVPFPPSPFHSRYAYSSLLKRTGVRVCGFRSQPRLQIVSSSLDHLERYYTHALRENPVFARLPRYGQRFDSLRSHSRPRQARISGYCVSSLHGECSEACNDYL